MIGFDAAMLSSDSSFYAIYRLKPRATLDPQKNISHCPSVSEIFELNINIEKSLGF